MEKLKKGISHLQVIQTQWINNSEWGERAVKERTDGHPKKDKREEDKNK